MVELARLDERVARDKEMLGVDVEEELPRARDAECVPTCDGGGPLVNTQFQRHSHMRSF